MIARTHAWLVVVACIAGCAKVDATPATTIGPSSTTPDEAQPEARPARPAPRPKQAPADPGEGERDELVGLTAAHNAERGKVGVPPLQWSRALARYAQSWADRLASRGCELDHRRQDKYGENLFWSSNPSSAEAVVAEWAAESVGYNRRANTCKGTCGHYTQLVWKETRMVGCGMAQCGSSQLWVCNYDPPGNVNGRRPY